MWSTWHESVPTTGLMHSDHRQPGRNVNRPTSASPRRTTSTWVLSGVRVSSGWSKLLLSIPAIWASPGRTGPRALSGVAPPGTRDKAFDRAVRPRSMDAGGLDRCTGPGPPSLHGAGRHVGLGTPRLAHGAHDRRVVLGDPGGLRRRQQRRGSAGPGHGDDGRRVADPDE